MRAINSLLKSLFILLLLLVPYDCLSQDIVESTNGITAYNYDTHTVIYDEFTDEYVIASFDSSKTSWFDANNVKYSIFSMYGGKIYPSNENSWIRGNQNFDILFIIASKSLPSDSVGNDSVEFLVDGNRYTKTGEYEIEESSVDFGLPNIETINKYIMLGIEVDEEELNELISSNRARIRFFDDFVINLNEESKTNLKILLDAFKSIQYKLNGDDGDDEAEKDAVLQTYDLSWEGAIDRSPMVQPLPKNTSNSEGVITLRFEVRPDGTVGKIIPLRKMNPELEREGMSTLRSWKFSRLPGGVPQQSQWGTITFRFERESQTNEEKVSLPPTEDIVNKEEYFVIVEQMPKLIGGMANLQNKVKYPEMARRVDIQGRVTVQFIVNEEGNVEDAKVVRSIGAGCDEEVLKVVKEAKFEPGMQRGNPVRVQYALSLNCSKDN